MKSQTRFIIAVLLAANLLATQACSYFFKSEYAELKAIELTAFAEAMPDYQKRQLAQNQAMRKNMIDQFKTPFAFAQAAEAEGMHKTDQFKRESGLIQDRLLAAEWSKRNAGLAMQKEEWEAYANAHKSEFEEIFALITKGRKDAPTAEEKDALRAQWAEMKATADKGRQAGLEKDLALQAQLKFNRANMLANAYSRMLEGKYKLTPAERIKYIAEHPEADEEKIRQKAQDVLDRLKKGEDFEKLAAEFNEDDTKTRGGELPWFDTKEGKMEGSGGVDPEFLKASVSLEKGQFTQEIVRSEYGFHLVRLDEKRTVAAPATPTPAPAAAAAPAPVQPEPPKGPIEQIRVRHIFFSLEEASSFEQRLIQEKIKRGLEDATLKYPVKVPEDFAVTVGGYEPGRLPSTGGGAGGQMRMINPNEKK